MKSSPLPLSVNGKYSFSCGVGREGPSILPKNVFDKLTDYCNEDIEVFFGSSFENPISNKYYLTETDAMLALIKAYGE